MQRILIINGPNLNLLGRREPEVYGTASMQTCLDSLRARYAGKADIAYIQSNHEGDIIDAIQQAWTEGKDDGIVLNAGAYTHTSLAIADAIASVALPVVEVHISNVWSRETIRHKSLISGVCRGVIAGFGLGSYSLAVEALITDN